MQARPVGMEYHNIIIMTGKTCCSCTHCHYLGVLRINRKAVVVCLSNLASAAHLHDNFLAAYLVVLGALPCVAERQQRSDWSN